MIIYIHYIDVGLINLISKFADDTKIGNSISNDCDRLNLQEDLRKISQWSERWEMPFMSTNVTFYMRVQVTKNLIMR